MHTHDNEIDFLKLNVFILNIIRFISTFGNFTLKKGRNFKTFLRKTQTFSYLQIYFKYKKFII